MSLFFCEALDGLGFWEKGGVITLVLCFLSFLFLFFMPERFTLRRIFAGVLSLYRGFLTLSLKVRGQTPSSAAHQRLVTGQTWDEFCDTLKAAGNVALSSGAPLDELNQAEAYRYLTRLARGGLEMFLECSDPKLPQLVSLVNGARVAPVKCGNDNPDNYYQSAVLSSEYSYRVWGKKNTVHYLGFGLQAGQYGKPGGLATVAYIEGDNVLSDKEGNFEIILSTTKPSSLSPTTNFMQMKETPKEGLLLVRQTFLDREIEVFADVHIERISSSSSSPSSSSSSSSIFDGFENAPAPMTAEKVEDGLQSSSMFVAGATLMFCRWVKGFQSHVNELPLFDQKLSDSVGGDPNIRYFHSYWRLKEGEALVIEANPPVCDTWNFQLSNHWMESLDYRYHTIHANSHTCKPNKEGVVRIVVSHKNPNHEGRYVGFWCSTAGHFNGCMCFRWVKPNPSQDGENLPYPRPQVVPFDELLSKNQWIWEK